MKSKILAFDQASYTTGYAYFENGCPVVVSHFDCTGNDLGDRLKQFRENVEILLNKYNPTEVIFEDIQLQNTVGGVKNSNGVKTYKVLAEVFGVLYELLSEKGIKNCAIIPNVWKATFNIAGKGRPIEKKKSQEWVLKTYNIKCTEDEADSVCIGSHYIKNQTESFDWT